MSYEKCICSKKHGHDEEWWSDELARLGIEITNDGPHEISTIVHNDSSGPDRRNEEWTSEKHLRRQAFKNSKNHHRQLSKRFPWT